MPVFGNLRSNKQLDRFTYRGQAKVTVQWLVYCLVHNIEKVAHLSRKYGPQRAQKGPVPSIGWLRTHLLASLRLLLRAEACFSRLVSFFNRAAVSFPN